MTAPKKADLQAELKALQEAFQQCQRDHRSLRDQADAYAKESRRQVDDLKTRLALSEADCQRMRGYIARVQEDDVVREELVTTGSPDGEQRLVPKRKPTVFQAASPYSHEGEAGRPIDAYLRGRGTPVPSPKHWVTY